MNQRDTSAVSRTSCQLTGAEDEPWCGGVLDTDGRRVGIQEQVEFLFNAQLDRRRALAPALATPSEASLLLDETQVLDARIVLSSSVRICSYSNELSIGKGGCQSGPVRTPGSQNASFIDQGQQQFALKPDLPTRHFHLLLRLLDFGYGQHEYIGLFLVKRKRP